MTDLFDVSRADPAEPSQMKCKLIGSNQLPVGQSRVGDVYISIKDKYGNEIVHVSVI